MNPENQINWSAVLVTSIPAFFLFLNRLIGMIERERMRKRGISVPIPPESPIGPAMMILIVLVGLLMSDFAGTNTLTKKLMKSPSQQKSPNPSDAVCTPPCENGQDCSGGSCIDIANSINGTGMVKAFPLHTVGPNSRSWSDGKSPFDRKPENLK